MNNVYISDSPATTRKIAAELTGAEEKLLVEEEDTSGKLAAFCFKNGKSPMAYEAAQKVVDLDPSLAGKAYMLLGTIWGSVVCGGNDIEQRAKYWVACDYMNKAKAADETLAEDAADHIRQYAAASISSENPYFAEYRHLRFI